MRDYIPDITERYPEGFGMPSRYDDYYDDSYEDIPYERETNARLFEVGQHYMWTDWFSGGQNFYTVTDRKGDTVVFSEYRVELDGEYKLKENFEVLRDENGDEYIKMCEYRGEEGRLYAEEVEV